MSRNNVTITIDELRDLIYLLSIFRYVLYKRFNGSKSPLLDCYFNYLIYLEHKYVRIHNKDK